MKFLLRWFLKAKLLGIILVIIIVAALGFLSYNKFYKPHGKTLHIKIPDLNIGDFNTQPKVETLIQKVGKLIELPSSEDLSVATIADISKLKDQPFFAHGQNGDKVLIYGSVKKAIIYRPSTNKIIEAGSVEITTGSQSSASDSANLVNPAISTQRKVLIQEK